MARGERGAVIGAEHAARHRPFEPAERDQRPRPGGRDFLHLIADKALNAADPPAGQRHAVTHLATPDTHE